MALSSYDELLKQVASLKSENCHLRRELQDNSSHLTKLENDASNMKDVLSHIQVSYGDLELCEQDSQDDCGKETEVEDFNEEDPALASHTSLCDDSFEDDIYQGQATAVGLEEAETSMTESAGSQGVDVFGLIQKLDSERKQLLLELERDEQQRYWFYNQLKTITQKMESLQHSEMYSDVARCQLELQAHKIEGAMQEKLGSGEQSKLRQEARLDRIRNIETEIRSLPGQAKQSLRDVKDAAVSTMLARDAFRIKPEQQDGVGGFAADRTVTSNGLSATVAVQTGEVSLVEKSDGVAPGIPLSSSLMVMYHGAWPMEKAMTGSSGAYCTPPSSQDLASVISFNSTNTNSSSSLGAASVSSQPQSVASAAGEQPQQLGTKVEMVYSLLSMLGTHDKDDMSRTLFAMSQSQDSCIAMRQSGCLPLLLQLLHGSEKDSGLLGKTRGSKAARSRAAAALHNIVHCNHDDKRGRREARTLRLLEQIRAYCDQQREESEEDEEEAVVSNNSEMDHHPGAAIAALMKLSFDEDYRHAICTLGGLQAIAELLEVDNRANTSINEYSTTIRRYSCMALTNLTFGDGKNKALLCSMHSAMEALTDQLRSTNEDLIQAVASVLRNLSWRADLASKKTLREIGAVTTLMRAAMNAKKETTLKSILSALWNLSSHCSENKAEICAVESALKFLVGLLTYKSTAKTLAIIENGGGILRNVSSQIAIREDYRQILRNQDCLKILLHHLRSPSLTIVSNACGTLWNLSARCEEDQNALREMGAISMLRNLVHSRHKMISSGSSAALRNLLSSIPAGKSVDSDRSVGSPRPTLHVRKQRALEAELDSNLSETCDSLESPRSSPTEIIHRSESEPRRFVYHQSGGGGADSGHRKEEDTRRHLTRRQMMPRNGSDHVNGHVVSSSGPVVRAGSQDSVGSTHSDISHDRTRAHTMLAKSSFLLHKRQGSSLERTEQQAVTHNSTPRPNNSHNIVTDHKTHNNHSSVATAVGHSSLGSGGVTIINNTPAHVRQSHHGSSHPQQGHQYQHGQGWQTMPNSRIVKYMHEVAMYAGVELSGNSHCHGSLIQSAPAHSQTFHLSSNQHQQQSLLDRLTKSASGLNNNCSLTNNLTKANTASCSTDHDGRRSLNKAAEDETDQPVNYSLKYRDVSNSNRGNKSSTCSNSNLPYSHLASSGTNSNFRNVPKTEHVGTSNMNERSFLQNNSGILDKTAAHIPRNNTLSNSAILTTLRSVPNVIHNRMHRPQGYQPPVVSHPHHNSPQFMTPRVPYVTPSFHPRGCLYSKRHPVQNPNVSLPSNLASASPGYTPQGKLLKANTAQFHQVQTAHQNTSPQTHPMQKFSTYAETDLDIAADQPTDFSLRYKEVTEEHCNEDYQEQPINYSMRYCDSRGRDDQELGDYSEEGPCVECKYAEARRTNEQIDISASDDQIRTFYTEGTPYLSTATSLTDLTQVGKTEEEEEPEEDSRIMDNKMNVDVERGGSRVDVNASASSSGSQTTDRHTGSTVIAVTKNSGLMALPSQDSSQPPDQHTVQQNFHADSHEGSLDQTKTYYEEGTPVCFSRVSSLSSLHCAEARDSVVHPRENVGHSRESVGHPRESCNNDKVELSCIDEADTPEAMVISVIENKGAICAASKSASSLRRAHTDQMLKGDRESKTVTFDENNQVEETPLMFSRCSSPESLSSFDTQSVHSSVISDYSRRASEVVSPSEIPDSPSESMPPSPRQAHSPTRRFKDFPSTPKSTNVIPKQSLDYKKIPSSVKVEPFRGFQIFDEEDKSINFALRNAKIPLLHSFGTFDDDQPVDYSFVDREQEEDHQTNCSSSGHLVNKLLPPPAKSLPTLVEQNAETESSSGKSEVPVVYAEEGTPPNFSETTSLSGITMASTSTRAGAAKQTNLEHQIQEPDCFKMEDKECRSEVVQKIEAVSVPCVAKDKPPGGIVRPPAQEQFKQDERDSSMSDVSEGEEDILAQCISSGMPTPVPSGRKMRRSSSDNTVKRKSGIPMRTPPDACSKTTSKLSSFHKTAPRKLILSCKSPPETVKSDNSSVENEELLLSQTIESGMPKSKPGRKSLVGADHSGGNGDGSKQSYRDSNNSAFIPRTSNITVVAPFHDFIPTDTIRTYNIEGTPGNFSAATSLSDLTIDSEGSKGSYAELIRSPKVGKGPGYEMKMDIKHSPSKLRMPTNMKHKQPSKSSSTTRQMVPQQIFQDDKRSCAGEEPDYITFSPPSNDTLHMYGVEGTPTTFSRNDSLSSLGGGKDSRGTGSGISASPHKDHRYADRDESDSSSSIPKERHVIGQSSEDSSVVGSRGDRPIKFAVEDTPVCFSRNSSLSSLNSIDKIEHPERSSAKGDCKQTVVAPLAKNIHRSESCDSLSDELADCDPTPSEQALLDQCISSAMPKSRLPKGEDRSRRHSRAKILTQKGAGGAGNRTTVTSGNGLTKSSSLEMSSVLTNGYHSSSEVDHGSQNSLSHDQGSSENLMTRSCSDTTELDLSFQIPQSSSKKPKNADLHQQKYGSHEDESNSFSEVCRKISKSFVGNISQEERDRLVSENVNLVMSEIQTTKMGGSTIDDELFIENETVSLISNDYASDTNSEISIAWSVASDKSTDPSSFALAESQNQASSLREGGPKILKPGTAHRPVKKADSEDEEVKAVRGRRKPLYPNRGNGAGVVAIGGVKTVASPGSRGVPNQVGIREVTHNMTGKSSSVPGVQVHKKTPPKNSNVTQNSAKNIATPGSSSKNGSPPQKNIDQKSNSRPAATPAVKSGAASPGTTNADKSGPRSTVQVLPQANRSNLVKAEDTLKENSGSGSKSSIASSTSVPSGQTSFPVGSSMTPGQLSPLTGAAKSPGQSRLPTASTGSKTNKTPGSGSKSSTSSTASDKRAGSKVLNDAYVNERGSGSGIPTRKSGGSSPSLNSSDLGKQTQPGSIIPTRCTTPGSVAKKQTPSKIAMLKKRDDSQERSSPRDSPLSSTSSSSSRLPVAVMKSSPASPKPTSLPPSGFKSKAATLPNSSFTSSKSRSVDDQISKSSTYEKIASELQDHNISSVIRGVSAVFKSAELDKNMRLKGGSFESPESGVRRGEVFELCDDTDNCDIDNRSYNAQPNSSYDPNESLDNNVFEDSLSSHQEDVRLILDSTSGSLNSLGQSVDTDSHIVDTGTFKRKKRGSSVSDFDLPNADETCRSMCSFNDSVVLPQISNSVLENHKEFISDINITSELSIIDVLQRARDESQIDNKYKHEDEKATGKTKSIVAKGLKKLFSSRHKDKEKDSKVKISDKESSKSKHSDKELKSKHSKASSKAKKNGKDKKDHDFLPPNIQIEPSACATDADKLICSQGTSTVSSDKQVPHKAEVILSTTNVKSNSSNNHVFIRAGEQLNESAEEGCEIVTSEKHMTKTEMLLARRRKTNLPGSHSDGSQGDGDVLAACLVTTV